LVLLVVFDGIFPGLGMDNLMDDDDDDGCADVGRFGVFSGFFFINSNNSFEKNI
jgi:hypothetical protein